MPLAISITLTDAVGASPAGGGTWQAVVRNNGVTLLDTGSASYSGAMLSAAPPITGPWTHLQITVTPARYAPVSVELAPSSTGMYRDDTLALVTALQQDTAALTLPLLRIREAVGSVPSSPPQAGSPLPGPWLQAPSGQATAVYRELQVTAWLLKRSNVTTMFDSSPTSGPFADPDKDGWDRFNTRGLRSDPSSAGAAMLLEYGEIGTSASGGPQFLVGIWAPTRVSNAPAPTWRDVVAFLHPSTLRTGYPQVAYPFRPPYPYAVGVNPQVPAGDPDLIYQPYVNLALRYPVGEWSPYRLAGNESIVLTPIFPAVVDKLPDKLEYALPFRTPAGLARLIAEVNLFLHRIRYGFSGTNFDRWWGARSIAAPNSSSVEAKAPTLRRAAVAAYSAAIIPLDPLLSGEALNNGRYPTDMWGVSSAMLDQFGAAWLETWCLDLLATQKTVLPAVFQTHLKAWVDANGNRKFLMGGSGTTGHDDPDAHYPALSKASASKISVQSPTSASRHAALWRGPKDQWTAIFCTNPFLSASAPDTTHWPAFPVAPSDDDAHAFMFRITSGFVIGTTTVGVP